MSEIELYTTMHWHEQQKSRTFDGILPRDKKQDSRRELPRSQPAVQISNSFLPQSFLQPAIVLPRGSIFRCGTVYQPVIAFK